MEEWRPIPGYDARYEVSSLGNVRRVKSVSNKPATGKNLRPRFAGANYSQYLAVCLYDGTRRLGYSKTIHRLVAVAFIGEPPTPAHQVNHIDGNKLNNAVSNLEWVTQSENMRHAFRLGLASPASHLRFGEAHHSAVLTEESVAAIRQAAMGGAGQTELAKRYGVRQSTIWKLLNGWTWTHSYLA